MLNRTFTFIVISAIINLLIISAVARYSVVAGLILLTVLPIIAGIIVAIHGARTELKGE